MADDDEKDRRPPRRPMAENEDENDRPGRRPTAEEEDEGDQPRRPSRERSGRLGRAESTAKTGGTSKVLLLGTLAMFGCCFSGLAGIVAVGAYDTMQEQKIAGKWTIDPTASQNASLPPANRGFSIEFETSGYRCVMMVSGGERRGTWAFAANRNSEAMLVRVDFEAASPPGAAQQSAFIGVFEVAVIDPDHVDVVDISNKAVRMRMVRVGK
jgi:hypothetical protein